jgi:CheY-like chemotaxis protein
MRVTILSERPETRAFLSRAIRALGCKSIEAVDDAVKAFDRAARFGCDLLLTDWSSPRNGAELVRRLRGREKTAQVVVVAVNALLDEREAALARSAGASFVVRTPYSLGSLCEGIAVSLAA